MTKRIWVTVALLLAAPSLLSATPQVPPRTNLHLYCNEAHAQIIAPEVVIGSTCGGGKVDNYTSDLLLDFLTSAILWFES